MNDFIKLVAVKNNTTYLMARSCWQHLFHVQVGIEIKLTGFIIEPYNIPSRFDGDIKNIMVDYKNVTNLRIVGQFIEPLDSHDHYIFCF